MDNTDCLAPFILAGKEKGNPATETLPAEPAKVKIKDVDTMHRNDPVGALAPIILSPLSIRTAPYCC